MAQAFITGLSGPELLPDEAAFLRDARPAGFILFRRNVVSGVQVQRLVADALAVIGESNVLVLIDQEGGRVQRIKAPIARDLPAAQAFVRLFESDPDLALRSAFAVARLAADELFALGITMNCAPVLDVPVPGSHDIIGDRAYGRTPETVIALAREVAGGLMAGGVAPVIKHIPGHGRATADSHLDLPVVATSHAELSATDFVPFKALNTMPAAMTAHVVYSSIDAGQPGSTSERVTREIIRGEIGFDGLLMSDDLSMKALSGSLASRAEAVISAGSDVALHCNGVMAEMVEVASSVPALDGTALKRFERACAATGQCLPYDKSEAIALLERVSGTSRTSESV